MFRTISAIIFVGCSFVSKAAEDIQQQKTWKTIYPLYRKLNVAEIFCEDPFNHGYSIHKAIC